MNVVLNKVIEILIGSSQLPCSEKKKKIRPKNSKRGGNGEETEGRRGRGGGTKQGENVSQRQRAKHGRAESERRYCHKLN